MKIQPTYEQAEQWHTEYPTHVMPWSSDQISFAEYVAQQVTAWALEQAALICEGKINALDHAGNEYRREAPASQCASAIRAAIPTPPPACR